VFGRASGLYLGTEMAGRVGALWPIIFIILTLALDSRICPVRESFTGACGNSRNQISDNGVGSVYICAEFVWRDGTVGYLRV
jgi:hypothetical protein